MRYERTVKVFCDGCLGFAVVTGTDKVPGNFGAKSTEGIAALGSIAITDVGRVLLGRGWVILSPRNADGSYERFEGEYPFQQLGRGSLIVCGNCAPNVKTHASLLTTGAPSDETDSIRSIVREELVKMLSERVA